MTSGTLDVSLINIRDVVDSEGEEVTIYLSVSGVKLKITHDNFGCLIFLMEAATLKMVNPMRDKNLKGYISVLLLSSKPF